LVVSPAALRDAQAFVNKNIVPEQSVLVRHVLRDSGYTVYDPISRLNYKALDLDNAIALGFSRAGVKPVTATSLKVQAESATALTRQKASARFARMNPGMTVRDMFVAPLASHAPFLVGGICPCLTAPGPDAASFCYLITRSCMIRRLVCPTGMGGLLIRFREPLA